MKKTRIILYHCLAWLAVIAYDLIGIYREQTPQMRALLWLQFSFLLSMISSFYYCYGFVYPRFLQRGKILYLALALLGAPLVFTCTRYAFEETLYPLLLGFRNYAEGTSLLYYLEDNLYNALPMMVVSAVVWLTQEAFQKEKENKLLRQEKTQAELAFLKSQVNPHFLYNTLNYIYSLAYPVSEQLAEAVLKLSDLMRYMLHDSPDGKVELRKEVEYVQSFIQIFRLRFEDRFYVDFDIHGSVTDQRVASLVLIPFVENAFKHGVVNDAAAPVQIQLRVSGQQLSFEVRNRISHQQKDHSTGIGLVNVRRRLELLYPGQHELTIHKREKEHHAQLILKTL